MKKESMKIDWPRSCLLACVVVSVVCHLGQLLDVAMTDVIVSRWETLFSVVPLLLVKTRTLLYAALQRFKSE